MKQRFFKKNEKLLQLSSFDQFILQTQGPPAQSSYLSSVSVACRLPGSYAPVTWPRWGMSSAFIAGCKWAAVNSYPPSELRPSRTTLTKNQNPNFAGTTFSRFIWDYKCCSLHPLSSGLVENMERGFGVVSSFVLLGLNGLSRWGSAEGKINSFPSAASCPLHVFGEGLWKWRAGVKSLWKQALFIKSQGPVCPF